MEVYPYLCRCQTCNRLSIWFKGKMLFPTTGTAPAPSSDLPSSVRAIYNEARSVRANSPRAAAALLRLSVETLCIELNDQEMKLDDHIALLVAKGLSQETANMFDAVRLGGNIGIHPIDRLGSIDNNEMVETLFWLVNEIAEEVITKPKRRQAATSWIPDDERERIEKRNQKMMNKLAKQEAQAAG
jgi:hypothetical protein